MAGFEVCNCETVCRGDSGFVWLVTLDTTFKGVPKWPSRVQYGVVPDGFVNEVEPRPLDQGCYRAWAGGTGGVSFEIDSSGGVRELLEER